MRALCRFIATGAAPLATTMPAAAELRPAGMPLVVLQNLDGRMEEFWIGSDCHLWHRWQHSDGSWSGPHDLKGCAVGNADGETNADGRLDRMVPGELMEGIRASFTT